MFDGLALEVKEVCALDGDDLTDGEVADALVELRRQQDALDAAVARLTRVFDVRRVYAPDGAKNASAWLTTRTRAPRTECRRQVRLARALDDMPLAGEAWSA